MLVRASFSAHVIYAEFRSRQPRCHRQSHRERSNLRRGHDPLLYLLSYGGVVGLSPTRRSGFDLESRDNLINQSDFS